VVLKEAFLGPEADLGEGPHECDAEAHARAEDEDGDAEAVHEAVVLHRPHVHRRRVEHVHLEGSGDVTATGSVMWLHVACT